MVVFLLTTPSVKAARAVTSLMVEHGTNPVLSASLWLTILRMRPLVGSTTTTLPAKVPRAATAARRMTRSSPSTLSPMVGSTPGTLAWWGSFFCFFLAAARLVVFGCCCGGAAMPASGSKVKATKGIGKNLFMQAALYCDIHYNGWQGMENLVILPGQGSWNSADPKSSWPCRARCKLKWKTGAHRHHTVQGDGCAMQSPLTDKGLDQLMKDYNKVFAETPATR